MKDPASLRSILARLTVLVTALALIVSGALVALTTVLHRTTVSSGASVESVRLAEEAEIDLLLHGRAGDPLVRADLEEEMRRRLRQAREFVTTDDEDRVLGEAGSRVEAYIAASREPVDATELIARYEAAYRALDRLVAINVAQSKAAQQDAARWDHLAKIFVFGLGALLLIGSGALISWLRGRAFAPILDLAAAMERFGRGDRDARATERGARELREMCSQFNEMAASIAAQRRAQIAFIGGIAHDLRNPLSALKTSLAVLESDDSSGAGARFHSTIDRMSRQILQMERMLGDFLDFAKIEAGQLELRLERRDAREIVDETAALFAETAPHHPLEIRTPPEAVPVRCDPVRMEQVITNLVSNAIKYSRSGSAVEVSLERRGSELVLCVADRGVGIAEADRSRIFEPFRRSGPSTESIPGVGLGLFVVRRIVESHGGRIEVESAVGFGSTFRVFLPIDPDSTAEHAPASQAPPALMH